MIWVENNVIILPEDAEELLKYAVSPVSVPKFVWDCFKTIEATGFSLTDGDEVIDKAVELGHGDAALWIKPNYDKYFDGMERGFEFEGEVIETTNEE